MERSSLLVRFGRMIQKSPLWLLQFIERPFLRQVEHECPSPLAVIIFGLPRSGSTVTYQTICHALQVNYLSNLWNLFYQLPLVGGFFSYYASRSHRSNFRSQHGFVGGLNGPAEGMKFWQWWLGCGLSDRDCQIHSKATLRRRSNYLRRVLTTLRVLNQQPFATAYLGHTLVPDRVDNAFPGAALIRLRRDPISNALSLLQSLRQNGGYWFSVKPIECEGLEGASEHKRVASQVYWLNRRLDQSECADLMLTIHYEHLCENPMKEVERIRVWCASRGMSVKLRHALPKSFPIAKMDFDSNIDAGKIKVELNILEARYGVLA